MSNVGKINQYYIPLEPAHVILAQACVTVLLQMDKKQGEEGLRALPLGSYAIDHWARHARFGDVASRIEDSLAYLFNPKRPYFKPQILLQCVMGMHDAYPQQPAFLSSEPDKVTPLFLAAFCGFSGLAKHLIITDALDVNAECGDRFSPLHGASENGLVDTAHTLLDGGANVNAKGYNDYTPLHYASYHGYHKLAQLLIKQGAHLNARTSSFQETPLHSASRDGHLEVVLVLLDHGADVNVCRNDSLTPYQVATKHGHHKVAQLLLEHGAERE